MTADKNTCAKSVPPMFSKTCAGTKVISFPGVLLERVRLRRSERLRDHRHDGVHVCLVMDGAFEERTPQGRELCTRGSVRISQSDVSHDILFGEEGAECLLLELRCEPSTGARPWTDLRGSAFFRQAPAADWIRDILREASTEACSPLRVEGRLLEFLAKTTHLFLKGEPPRKPEWLDEARGLIASIPSHDLTVAALARRVGVHRAHLVRTFLKHTGSTVQEMIRRRRLEDARQALISSDQPISAIALVSGYADQSHLTKVFRRHLHTTPLAYRQAFRVS